MDDQGFLQQAIYLAKDNVEQGGRPFGAVIVKNGEVVSQGVNQILTSGDPTSHAELNALRQACENLKSLTLKDCTVYASGQPCPMCLAALRMAGVEKIVYAYSNADAEPFGLSTAAIAEKLRQEPHRQEGLQFVQLSTNLPFELYEFWKQKQTF
ncbi:nucleoside deaminase [Acinetobacter gerneri]|uniref:Nucleoside deaminase n=1 Tax=Acinetobacter gerneri TaxID=202952 RepID=A0AAW8JJI0_9GAMM|nr:nucleoside deaminase [Acinetobacter gerneri]MDQ9009414.1 nucleoside deaminase [Acinetobacter gerneri]MDQ9013384.1 nucleoside deaminase [Acinetobacter gerneri]MDQ9024666.1 nucleoside deaminase [Acinetobacter gerneri]MDQ9052056.1 nucleoside deaminase [Acinetobacter gerneri]MDQ9059589.1 nucleoside deaminase [Acinetobacter gerneri]